MNIPANELKEWEQHGISFTEPDDDILELRHHGKVVARFCQASVSVEEIRKEVQKIIAGKPPRDRRFPPPRGAVWVMLTGTITQ